MLPVGINLHPALVQEQCGFYCSTHRQKYLPDSCTKTWRSGTTCRSCQIQLRTSHQFCAPCRVLAWLVPPLKMYYELNCSHYTTEFFKVYAEKTSYNIRYTWAKYKNRQDITVSAVSRWRREWDLNPLLIFSITMTVHQRCNDINGFQCFFKVGKRCFQEIITPENYT